MAEQPTRTDDIERQGIVAGLTRRRALALAASGALAGTASASRADSNEPNAEVHQRDGEYVAENYDTDRIDYRGGDFVHAMQAAVDSLDPERTAKEHVLVSATGEIGTHEWDGSVEGVDLPSNTIFEVSGHIHVDDDGEELVVPVRATDVESIEIPALNVSGNPRYGLKLGSVSDVTIGTVRMRLWATSDVGLGVRIDDSRGSRSRNVSLESASVEGSAGHAVETYGVDGFDVGTVETADTGGCGLLLNDTTDATVQRVDAVRADQGGGYAGFRCANDAGPNVTLHELRAVDCGRGFFTVSGSQGIEIRNVDVERCGGCLIQDTTDVLVDGGSIRNNDGSGVRIDSRSDDDYQHARNVTVQNLELTGNAYGVRETGPDTESNAILNNYLCGNDRAGIETYASDTIVDGNTYCSPDGSPIADGTYVIRNAGTGMVLDVAGGMPDDGTNVQQWAYWNSANQHWNVTEEGDGAYRIENERTGKVLDVAARSTADGANLLQWTDHGEDHQRFEFVAHGNGECQIQPVHSGKALDVERASGAHGANVHQWTYADGAHQRWTLESV
jgi:hypothetical protein